MIKQDPVVFVLHTAPDAPAVDVLAGGTDAVLVDALSFGDLSSAVQVPPASYDLDVVLDEGGAFVKTVSTPMLAAGERYLAVASGFGSDPSREFTLIPMADGFGTSSDALLRVLHASPGRPRSGTWERGTA